MAIVPIDPAKRSQPATPAARLRVGTRATDKSLTAKPRTHSDEPSEADAEYKIGYRNPPRHTQFKPGRSGNPKGRPNGAKGLPLIVRETLTQKITVRTATGTKRISRIEAVLQKTVEQAMKGNPRALAELLKLYGNAVPEEKHPTPEGRQADLTDTDLATLEELRLMLSEGEKQAP